MARWWMVLAIPALATAAPITVQHQARLLDASGQPVQGEVTLLAGVYPDGSTSTPLWSETFTATPQDGYVSLVLGTNAAGNPLQDSVFDGSARYVGLTIGGSAMPRQLIATVPSAVFASRAATADVATSVAGGTLSLTGPLTLGDSAGDTCATAGGVRYHASNSSLQVCDGSAWVTVISTSVGTSQTNPATTCKQLHFDRPSLTSGKYWLKPSGWVGLPFEAWCDMETDGGGWMLTFKMKNDGGDHSPNYFPYLNGGSGTTPPTTLGNNFAQGGGWNEGPTMSGRWTLWGVTAATEYRGSTYNNGGALLLDMKSSTNKDTGNTWFCAATGCSAGPTGGYSNASMGTATALKSLTPLGMNFVAGQNYSVYNHGHYGCDCWEGVFIGGDYTNGAALFTDHNHSGRYLGDYTLFWIR
jgi:hypothetical protein